MLPIAAYGHPILKQKGVEISKDYPDLEKFIAEMFETMYYSKGVGLAAQQVNRAIRLFVIDASYYGDEFPEAKDFKKVFINAQIVEEEGEPFEMEEGCLSVPGINEYVMRKPVVYLSYYDEHFNYYEKVRFEGMVARIIQHEYDHIEGIVFVEKVPNLKRILLKGKLKDLSAGKTDAEYKMIFAKKRIKR